MPTADRLFDERFEQWLRARGSACARILEPIYDEIARPIGAPPDVARTVAVLRWLIDRGRDDLLLTTRDPLRSTPVRDPEAGARCRSIVRPPGPPAGAQVLFSHLEKCGWFTSSGGRVLPSPLLRRLDGHPRALWAVVADGLLVRSDGFGGPAEPVFASLLRCGDLPGLGTCAVGPATARVLPLIGAFGGWVRHAEGAQLSPGGRATLRRALRASVLSSHRARRRW
ncbi:MAG TPA: hypothetical protein VM784_15090 [Actinomycetota bacterium]|nr:hypothetical protein [Actinomycetota bacterium]